MTKSPSEAQLAWYSSSRFRTIGSTQAKKLLRARALLPRCGAYAKSTGKPCMQAAMSNGRCFAHGGRTPAGKDWHRVQWPDGSAPNAEERLNGKLRALDKRARQQKQRLARMTPEERAAHVAWQKAHRPGDPAARAQRRADAKAARQAQIERQKPRPVSRETRALLDEIAAGEARLAALRHEAELEENWTVGVFG